MVLQKYVNAALKKKVLDERTELWLKYRIERIGLHWM